MGKITNFDLPQCWYKMGAFDKLAVMSFVLAASSIFLPGQQMVESFTFGLVFFLLVSYLLFVFLFVSCTEWQSMTTVISAVWKCSEREAASERSYFSSALPPIMKQLLDQTSPFYIA